MTLASFLVRQAVISYSSTYYRIKKYVLTLLSRGLISAPESSGGAFASEDKVFQKPGKPARKNE